MIPQMLPEYVAQVEIFLADRHYSMDEKLKAIMEVFQECGIQVGVA